MPRTLERIIIAAVAATAAFAVATATGQSGSRQSGFIDIPPGARARFLHTTTTCVNPRQQIRGGQVGCNVDYRMPRSVHDSPPPKFELSLTLRCVEYEKWSRTGAILKSGRLC